MKKRIISLALLVAAGGMFVGKLFAPMGGGREGRHVRFAPEHEVELTMTHEEGVPIPAVTQPVGEGIVWEVPRSPIVAPMAEEMAAPPQVDWSAGPWATVRRAEADIPTPPLSPILGPGAPRVYETDLPPVVLAPMEMQPVGPSWVSRPPRDAWAHLPRIICAGDFVPREVLGRQQELIGEVDFQERFAPRIPGTCLVRGSRTNVYSLRRQPVPQQPVERPDTKEWPMFIHPVGSIRGPAVPQPSILEAILQANPYLADHFDIFGFYSGQDRLMLDPSTGRYRRLTPSG